MWHSAPHYVVPCTIISANVAKHYGNISFYLIVEMQPYSRTGGTRKCFYEFQTLVSCYTSSETSTKKECTPIFDDYFECLHGYKEREKARLMYQQLKANESSDKNVGPLSFYSHGGENYKRLDLV